MGPGAVESAWSLPPLMFPPSAAILAAPSSLFSTVSKEDGGDDKEGRTMVQSRHGPMSYVAVKSRPRAETASGDFTYNRKGMFDQDAASNKKCAE